MSLKQRVYRALWPCMAMFMAHPAHAKCTSTGVVDAHTYATTVIPLRFGHINLTAPPLQPDGASLGSTIAPATGFTYRGAKPDDILWECDRADVERGDVYFMVSTNADSSYGGRYEVGGDGSGIYGTWFKYVGLRLRMGNTTLTDHWQPVPLGTVTPNTALDPKTGTMREIIEIRLRDVPAMEAELFKISNSQRGVEVGSLKRRDYTYLEPGGYVQLVGPGLRHDPPGSPHKNNYRFYPSNGLGWGLYQGVTLSQVATCVANVLTPHVHFDEAPRDI